MTSLRVATARLFDRIQPEDRSRFDAEFAVAPETLEQAAEVLALAADQGMAVGFSGGGTHAGIGGPIATDVVVASERLNGIIDYQPEDLTVVVGAGTPVADLAATLASDGVTAVLAEMPGSATVGGTIAAGVSGYRRLRYGATRERVLEVSMATGYGRVVRAGGRVVKNSTGYDVARLAVGSLGSIGLIGSVCLKLWPAPIATATVAVDDPVSARHAAYRPLAIVETESGAWAFVGGTDAEVASQAAALGGTPSHGLCWPEPIDAAVRFELRVPARSVPDAVALIRPINGLAFRAQHGVGVVEAGLDRPDTETLTDVRAWAERLGGSLVLLSAPADVYAEIGAWGTPLASLRIQSEVKRAFDPAAILNPGKLPGGL